jgi:hypothetical protein
VSRMRENFMYGSTWRGMETGRNYYTAPFFDPTSKIYRSHWFVR